MAGTEPEINEKIGTETQSEEDKMVQYWLHPWRQIFLSRPEDPLYMRRCRNALMCVGIATLFSTARGVQLTFVKQPSTNAFMR
jgi:hypothetical protein